MTALAWSLLLVPVLPGILALVTLVWRQRDPGGWFSTVGALPAVLVGLFGPTGTVDYPWLFLGARLGLDQVDALFLLFSGLVWTVAGAFAEACMRGEGRRRFFVFFLLAMAGNLGALVAQDLPSFYGCFALMSFAAYGLVLHSGTDRAAHAARVYIVLVLVGEAALALAMLLAVGQLGFTDFVAVRTGLPSLPDMNVIVAFAVLGFGIKAGAPVLHVWLPLAHPVAPAPASAVLSGTMIATGLVGWLRFLPAGEVALPVWGSGFILIGLAAAFCGVFVGLSQREPKVVLAYSSVSQMGIMTVAVGGILLAPQTAQALALTVAFFALHHGLAKSALFLGAGLARADLMAKGRRSLLWGLALPSLALAGAPLTSGMLAKSAMVAGGTALPDHWSRLLYVALPLASVATALLMARFLVLVSRERGSGRGRAAPLAWLAWLAAVALVVTLPWRVRPTLSHEPLLQQAVAGSWPIAVALLLAGGALWAWRLLGRPSVPTIPEGDVLAPLEFVLTRLGRVGSVAIELIRTRRDAARERMVAWRHGAWAAIVSLGRAEAWLNRWQTAFVLLSLLGASIALLAVR